MKERTLAENEAIIERGLEAYREAGLALKEIRSGKQYKPKWKTFEAYCKDRWQMSIAQGKRLIAAANTAEAVAPIGSQNPAPATERVAREIKGTPEQKRVIWNKAVKQHGNKPTAEQTRKVAEKEKVVNIDSKRRQHERRQQRQPQKFDSLAHDPAVIEWVWDLMDEGWNRDEIVAASKRGSDGWPLKGDGDSLSNGAVGECKAAIVHLKRLGTRPAPADKRRKAPAKLREIRKEATGNFSHLLDLQVLMVEMTNKLSRYNVEKMDLDEMEETTVWTLEDLHKDLTEHTVWVERTLTSVQARMSDASVRAKIKQMREGIAGRPAEEIDTARKLADRLERKLDARLKSA